MIKQISNEEINDAKEVLESFVVNSIFRESALESGIFAIANQSSRWERPAKIIYALREETYRGEKNARNRYCNIELLRDEPKIHKIAVENGYRFRHQRRFKPFLDYFGPISDNWWEDIFNASNETREFYTNEIKFLQCKTFSFWHLCLGGTNLLPIDIHVRREAKELGVKIDDKYIIAKERIHRKKRLIQKTLSLFEDFENKIHETQSVVEEPNKLEYLRIEKEILNLFEKDARFTKEGKINAGLVASVLWWRGANRGENYQTNLFTEHKGTHWKLPYGTQTLKN